jgi:transposase
MAKHYPREVRERAVRLVLEHEAEYESRSAAIRQIAVKCGVGGESLRVWVRQARIDAGARAGVTSQESAQIKALRRENAELRRANEILKAASAFFAAELDRPTSTR